MTRWRCGLRCGRGRGTGFANICYAWVLVLICLCWSFSFIRWVRFPAALALRVVATDTSNQAALASMHADRYQQRPRQCSRLSEVRSETLTQYGERRASSPSSFPVSSPLSAIFSSPSSGTATCTSLDELDGNEKRRGRRARDRSSDGLERKRLEQDSDLIHVLMKGAACQEPSAGTGPSPTSP